MALQAQLAKHGLDVWSACSKALGGFFKSPSRLFGNKATASLSTLCSPPAGQSNNTKTSKHCKTESSGNKIYAPGLLSRSFVVLGRVSMFPFNLPVRHYQSVLRPRLHCKGCYFVWRHGRKFVECSDVPSHKQMKKLATRKVWLEDYTRGDVNDAMKWNRDLKRIADRHVDRTVISHNWFTSRLGKDI